MAAIKGGMSRNQTAKQFGGAISTAINWAKRADETGSVEPGQMGGHKPKAISGENMPSGCNAASGRATSPCEGLERIETKI